MLKTIRGDDGKPYISLEDLMEEVDSTRKELEDKLNDDLVEEIENVEDRIDFLDKLYDSLKNIQSEYYKKILGYDK